MNRLTDTADWSETEIKAAVDCYLSIKEREQRGQRVNKSLENRTLREKFLPTRTHGSVEFRMRNISTVLVSMGQSRVEGYKPAKNVGAKVEHSIREALEGHSIGAADDLTPTPDEATLEIRAAALEKRPLQHKPRGILKPQPCLIAGKSYVRDPEVRAWVRMQAEGTCEGCGHYAPFEKDGIPFLEVHHVKHLANEGSDRITNAVALCPNCHRRCHHSSDKDDFTSSLYDKVERLERE